MSLNIVANGTLGWSIEENNDADAFLLSIGGGRYTVDASAAGGAGIFADGVRYYIEPAYQPAVTVGAERFTIGATAVPLNQSTYAGQTLYIRNTHGSAAIDIGGADVVAGGGLALAAAASVTLTIKPGDVVYAVRSAATDVTVTVFRT
jgi:hypothetical protein